MYRGEDKTGMSLYKTLNADGRNFIDGELTVNTKYTYAIRAVYKDGKYSDTKTVKVTY